MRHRLFTFLLLATCVGRIAGGQIESDAYLGTLRHRGYVNDFAGVIPDAEEGRLERLLTDLERKTGAEVAVVAVDSMQGGEVNDFANRLFEQWGIGKKGKDNGALLFAAIRDRKARIEVGYGLEGLLPDARAGRILDENVLPWFQRGQYGNGLVSGALAVAGHIADEAGVTLAGRPPAGSRQQTRGRNGGGFSWFHLLLFILLIPVLIRHPWLLLLFLSGGRGGGFSGGGFGGGAGGFGGGLSGGGGASRGW